MSSGTKNQVVDQVIEILRSPDTFLLLSCAETIISGYLETMLTMEILQRSAWTAAVLMLMLSDI